MNVKIFFHKPIVYDLKSESEIMQLKMLTLLGQADYEIAQAKEMSPLWKQTHLSWGYFYWFGQIQAPYDSAPCPVILYPQQAARWLSIVLKKEINPADLQLGCLIGPAAVPIEYCWVLEDKHGYLAVKTGPASRQSVVYAFKKWWKFKILTQGRCVVKPATCQRRLTITAVFSNKHGFFRIKRLYAGKGKDAAIENFRLPLSETGFARQLEKFLSKKDM